MIDAAIKTLYRLMPTNYTMANIKNVLYINYPYNDVDQTIANIQLLEKNVKKDKPYHSSHLFQVLNVRHQFTESSIYMDAFVLRLKHPLVPIPPIKTSGMSKRNGVRSRKRKKRPKSKKNRKKKKKRKKKKDRRKTVVKETRIEIIKEKIVYESSNTTDYSSGTASPTHCRDSPEYNAEDQEEDADEEHQEHDEDDKVENDEDQVSCPLLDDFANIFDTPPSSPEKQSPFAKPRWFIQEEDADDSQEHAEEDDDRFVHMFDTPKKQDVFTPSSSPLLDDYADIFNTPTSSPEKQSPFAESPGKSLKRRWLSFDDEEKIQQLSFSEEDNPRLTPTKYNPIPAMSDTNKVPSYPA